MYVTLYLYFLFFQLNFCNVFKQDVPDMKYSLNLLIQQSLITLNVMQSLTVNF